MTEECEGNAVALRQQCARIIEDFTNEVYWEYEHHCGGVAFLWVGHRAPAANESLRSSQARHIDGSRIRKYEQLRCDSCGESIARLSIKNLVERDYDPFREVAVTPWASIMWSDRDE